MIKRKNIQYYKTQSINKFTSVAFRNAIEKKRINKLNNNKDETKN